MLRDAAIESAAADLVWILIGVAFFCVCDPVQSNH